MLGSLLGARESHLINDVTLFYWHFHLLLMLPANSDARPLRFLLPIERPEHILFSLGMHAGMHGTGGYMQVLLSSRRAIAIYLANLHQVLTGW